MRLILFIFLSYLTYKKFVNQIFVKCGINIIYYCDFSFFNVIRTANFFKKNQSK